MYLPLCLLLVVTSLGVSVARCYALILIREPRRVEIHGSLENLSVVPLEQGAPGEDPSVSLNLEFFATLPKRLQIVVEATATAGGTLKRSSGPAVLDLNRAFQNHQPRLDFHEAYLQWSQALFDLRLGLQRFAWGKLDFNRPSDLLNPKSYLDPIVYDEESRKIGVPALAIDVYPETEGLKLAPAELRLTAVWVPAHASFRFPKGRERWYPPAGRPPLKAGELFWFLREHNATPPRGIKEGNLGVRVGGLSRGLDWAAYFYEGYDPRENFTISNSVKDAAFAEMFVDIKPAYRRVRAVGADLAYAAGGMGFRFEGMYFARRGYPMAVLSIIEKLGRGGGDFLARFIRGETVSVYPERDAVEWGLGVDMDLGRMLALLQFNQVILLHNDVPLLLDNVDSAVLGSVTRKFLGEEVEGSIVGLYFIESEAFMLQPSLHLWFRGELEVQAGLLAIGGAPRSLLGQYTHNDEVYLRVRYHF